MMNRCNECGATLHEDEERGEIVCNDCGLVLDQTILDPFSGPMLHGDASHSEIARSTRLGDDSMEGTTFNPNDCRGRDRGNWNRLNRHQNRARRSRRVFADDVMDHIQSMGIGRNVVTAARTIVEATLLAQEDEKEASVELGRLPLNEIRFMKRSRLEKEQTAAMAAVMTAAAMAMIPHCRPSTLRRGWNISTRECSELAKRMKKRVCRMRRMGRVSFIPPQRPSSIRRDMISEGLDGVRRTLSDDCGLSKGQTSRVIERTKALLDRLGEPESDSATSNERVDMLIATIVKEVCIEMGIRGLNQTIASALGLSAGGVSQRHKRLSKLFRGTA